MAQGGFMFAEETSSGNARKVPRVEKPFGRELISA
jgi:hypothetical protein